MSLVSLKSVAYWALSKAGGAGGRNCEGDWMTHGVTCASCGASPGANAGRVGRHSPGAVPPVNGDGMSAKPS
jgi:hypothetical protein